MRLAVAAALLAGVLACKAGDGTQACDNLQERIVECAGPEKPPRGAMAHLRSYCRVAMQYEPGPDEKSGNLAELTKAAITECAALTECDELTACLNRNRCQFYLSDPSDTSLEFQCTPPAD